MESETLWEEVEYKDRQVYAAIKNVPLILCLGCNYLRKTKDSVINNKYGQPGICCFCRSEAKIYKMTGLPPCIMT